MFSSQDTESSEKQYKSVHYGGVVEVRLVFYLHRYSVVASRVSENRADAVLGRAVEIVVKMFVRIFPERLASQKSPT